ncbi:AAA family ATPase [Patescibacteria group bacterium]|nr:AAA family ATPase [Patescibacteria group bacterium]MBU0963898.1 AAA family ATPase [Patescibacteria group bacterium]
MYLQKLNIQGFKSFANKTSLEFTPGVTAVVGPNGSGKSNIADAVRWVLGEQSLKTLRGKKSGDVIFAGSDKKTRLGYCQVDLHLNNEDHKAPVDYPEIVISRKVYRDGEGEYFINKTRVRLQDILMLLAKSNFGQRSYSIISQGMVDQFLSATPTQRKEFFDEAAGVRQFQIKKEQAENKMSLTKENLKQAELLIQEIEPRLRSLTRQVKRLERKEEVTKELKQIQHSYYAGLWHDLKKKHEAEEINFQSAEEKRKKVSDETVALQDEMKQLALGESRQDTFQNLQQEYNRMQEEKNGLLKEHTVLKGKLELDREQAGELDLVWLERRRDQLKNHINNLRQSINQYKEATGKYSEQLSEKDKELQQINQQHQKLNNKLAAAKNELNNKKVITVPEVADKVASIYNQQKELLEKIESVQTPEELQIVKAEAKALTTRLSQLTHQLRESGTGNPHEVISIQDQITKLLTKKDEFINIINELNIKVRLEEQQQSTHQIQADQAQEEFQKITKELERAKSDKSPADLASDIAEEEKQLQEKIKQAEERLKQINDKISGFNQAEQDKKEEVFALQNKFSKKQEELNSLSNNLNAIKVELAKLETRQEDLEKEMIDEMNDEERKKIYEVNQPPAAKPELFQEIQKFKRQLELIGGIDPQVAEEYNETKERYDFLTTQSNDLNKAMEDLEKAIANLEETIKKQFDRSFQQINEHFTEYFKMLFNGGNASLSMVKEEKKALEENEDEDEDADEEEKEASLPEPKPKLKGTGEKVITGIDIHATPPGKRLRGIAMLSGGERALTSIALICAIIHNNPSPFVILDEVDAALDESNSIRFAAILDKLAKKAQFVVVTHNRATMDKAHTLYGVTMGDDGVSKLLSVDMKEAEKVIANNK